jgi:hypothetical protein
MTVKEMRDVVFEKRPKFKKIIDAWGEKNLLDYYSQEFKNLRDPSTDFLSALYSETLKYFPEHVAKDAVASLTTEKWVNTADHHGLLCHPYFYTTALTRSHGAIRKEQAVTVTLPFSCISTSNDSFPRGFFFHDAEGNTQKIIFKSLKNRHLPVYVLPPLTKEEFVIDIQAVHRVALSNSAQKRLLDFLESLEHHETLWDQPSYSAQLIIMNAILWKSLFGDSRGEFVYIPIEDIVVKLLLAKHLKTDTTLGKVLFEKKWRDSFATLFYPKQTKPKGTEFFWYIDYKENASRPLSLVGNSLQTHEGDVTISLTPEGIEKGLRNKTLMPSTALMMILLQGEEGVACGGGPNQLEYLDEYMSKWAHLCSEHGVETNIPTTQIWCEANTLFHIKNSEGNSEPATLFDVLLHCDNPSSFIDEALKNTSINSSVDTLIPTFYYLYTRTKTLTTEVLKTQSLDITK